MRALTCWDLTVGSVAEPDTAAEHADFIAGETSSLEFQQGFQSGAGGKPCESRWVHFQGLLRGFTSLILIVVYSSMAASRAAGTPPPLAPPSHPPGEHPALNHPLCPYTHIPGLQPSILICFHCLRPGLIPHLWELGAAHALPSPPAATHLWSLWVGLSCKRHNNIYPLFVRSQSLVGSAS